VYQIYDINETKSIFFDSKLIIYEAIIKIKDKSHKVKVEEVTSERG